MSPVDKFTRNQLAKNHSTAHRPPKLVTDRQPIISSSNHFSQFLPLHVERATSAAELTNHREMNCENRTEERAATEGLIHLRTSLPRVIPTTPVVFDQRASRLPGQQASRLPGAEDGVGLGGLLSHNDTLSKVSWSKLQKRECHQGNTLPTQVRLRDISTPALQTRMTWCV